MKKNRNTFWKYMIRPGIAAAIIALVICLGAAPSHAGKSLPVDLLRQWQKLRAESPDTGRVAELFDEGERIIARLQELDDLRLDPQHSAGKNYEQRIARLQNHFKDLLRRVEMARLTSLPREEIAVIRNRYEEERRKLETEVRALEDTILVRGERFLDTYKQKIDPKLYMGKQEMIVDFIYRLAEIYYRRGEDQFFISNDISAFQPALQKYQRIIDEFPASEYVDDALYNIAYVKNSSQSEEDRLEAITLFNTLIQKYHNSAFVPEAYWRVAEYYFYQKPPQTDRAIDYYASLLNYEDTHWYVRALYKIGWCHYLDLDYPAAIDYFTQTVEASLDTARFAGDLLFASVLDEALEYISVCFAQDKAEWEGSGVAAAVAFIQEDSLRRATYGKRILEYLGDIYKFQVGKYPVAIEAYKAYLDLYPLDAKAPWVQEKIINCYATDLRQFDSAYEEKDRLFALYRAGQEWDAANPDSALRAAADVVIEKYYFQNINETIGRAVKTEDLALLERSVQMSRNYLEAFPTGPNAYTVHYNLAILLDQHLANNQEAYQEYIKVSTDYSDDKHRKTAAISAVVIAQRMIAQGSEVTLDSLKGAEISEAEQKYIDGIDNFLAFFPQGEEAERFLVNAGGVYYNHGMYSESRQYYNRLLEDFPDGQRRAEAYSFVMNGYFAEGSYLEAERVAKEIQAAGFDSSTVAMAKVRQAESVFLNAQDLKEQGDLLAAAAEYRRTALENPGYNYADKALFESGLAFQEASAWAEANDVYLMLVDNYPQSELADKALYNIGYNCQSELGAKATAAATFERLTLEYPQSPLAQDAMRNASINYVESMDWAGAIRINTAYVQTFPEAPDANLFLFEIAGLYLKLGDEVAANQTYAEYAARFPNDPRTVRAHWERARYFRDQGRRQEALAEFKAGIEAHRALVSRGQVGEETYASRCLFEVIEAEFEVYQSIRFAPANAVEKSKTQKLAQREHLLKLLEELNSLAKDEMFEGLYTVGKVEEELSRAFADQALPEGKRAEEKILTREVANQDAIEIARRAMDAYAKATEDIAAAAQVLQLKVDELAGRKERLSQWLLKAQKSDPKPEGLVDSTVALADLDRTLEEVRAALLNAQDWGRRAQEKIPELALRNAEIKFATVQAFLDLPDVGKTEELRMLYRSGVLSEFAAPRSTVVVQLYRQAIEKAAYSAAAEEWKAKALDGVTLVFDALDHEYRSLNERSLEAYSRDYRIYQNLLSRGEGATTSKGLEAADIAERLVLYSDYSYDFATGALAAQSALLDSCEQGEEIPLEACSRFVASALEEVFRINDRYMTLAAEATDAKSEAEQRQSESVLWEDAVMTFEDCAYNFSGHQEELLTGALAFNQAHGDDRALALRLSWALVDLDREAYLSLLADYGEEAWVRSDDSFVVNTSFEPSWEAVDYSDKAWISPHVSEAPAQEGELAGSKALWVALKPDTVVSDSLYLRKVFVIKDAPVAGDLWISVDGGYALQLNGEFIGAVEPGESWTEVAHYDVAQTLRKGENAIAILAVDPDSTVGGVELALRYKVLPLELSGGP